MRLAFACRGLRRHQADPPARRGHHWTRKKRDSGQRKQRRYDHPGKPQRSKVPDARGRGAASPHLCLASKAG